MPKFKKENKNKDKKENKIQRTSIYLSIHIYIYIYIYIYIGFWNSKQFTQMVLKEGAPSLSSFVENLVYIPFSLAVGTA